MMHRFRGAAGTLALGLMVSSSARAEPRTTESITFHFSCPELTGDQLAEVEARSRIEAQLAGQSSLLVALSCRRDSLLAEVRVLEPESHAEHFKAVRDGRPLEVALVELFVRALEALPKDREAGERAAAGSGDRHDAEGAEQPADSQSPAMAARSEPPRAAKTAPAATTSPKKRAHRDAARKTRDQNSLDTEPSSRQSVRAPFARLGVDLLASYKTLGPEALGSFGFGVMGLWGITERLRLGPLVRVGWAAGAQNLELTTWNFALLTEYSPLEWLSLGLGPELSFEQATIRTPRSASGTHALLGGRASADVLFGTRHAALRAGITVSVLSSDRILRLEGEELMRLPAVSLELQLGARFGFLLE